MVPVRGIFDSGGSPLGFYLGSNLVPNEIHIGFQFDYCCLQYVAMGFQVDYCCVHVGFNKGAQVQPIRVHTGSR